jgi:hypothetical protein
MPKEKITGKVGPSSVKRKKVALGRGLGALIPDLDTQEDKPSDYLY